MTYQDRADIDELIKTVDDLKYYTRLDEKKQVATLDDIKDNSSEIIKKIIEYAIPITITFADNSTMDGFIIDEDFFNELE